MAATTLHDHRLTFASAASVCVYNVCAGRSIMDYPGFQSAEPPDFETFSKSINAGQYPLSVLALGPRVPEIYVQVRRHPLWQLPPCTRARACIVQVRSRPSGVWPMSLSHRVCTATP